jgi:TatD DNase family protein
MSLIDTHAHLYAEEFSGDIDEVIDRSLRAGVQKIYMPNIDSTSIEAMLAIEEKYPEHCISMMGLHPCYVKEGFEKELYIVENWINKRKFAAVGEIGTDLYWDTTFWEQQQEAFKVQLDMARKNELPVVIHCRNSLAQTMDIVEQIQDGRLKGIFHCFGGTVEDAARIAAMGFMIGIGGVATFKKGGLDTVLPHVDLATVVLETDSPYLAPVPFRGKRNESSYLALVADRVAGITGITRDEVAKITSDNAIKIFNI